MTSDETQAIIDLCAVHGWAAVLVPKEAGSEFPGGHIHVFYRDVDGTSRSRMLFNDARVAKQLQDLLFDSRQPTTVMKGTASTAYKTQTQTRYAFGATDPRGLPRFGDAPIKEEGKVIRETFI
jgi:hypothetical protein